MIQLQNKYAVGFPLLPLTEWLVPDELPLKMTTKAKQKTAAGHQKTSERHQRSWVSLTLGEEKPFWTKTFLKTLTVLRLWDYVRRKWVLGEQIFSRSFRLKCSREKKRCVKDTNAGRDLDEVLDFSSKLSMDTASKWEPTPAVPTNLQRSSPQLTKAAYRYPVFSILIQFNVSATPSKYVQKQEEIGAI